MPLAVEFVRKPLHLDAFNRWLRTFFLNMSRHCGYIKDICGTLHLIDIIICGGQSFTGMKSGRASHAFPSVWLWYNSFQRDDA